MSDCVFQYHLDLLARDAKAVAEQLAELHAEAIDIRERTIDECIAEVDSVPTSDSDPRLADAREAVLALKAKQP